jgi:hypothetical protein
MNESWRHIGGGKSRYFKRPDEDESDRPGRVVKAKPIASNIARKLGGFTGRDFVGASARSQSDFYGQQHVVHDTGKNRGHLYNYKI